MTPKQSLAADEAQIRELVDDWAGAVRAKNIDRIMSHYAPHIVAFDAVSQLQFRGADAYRSHWEACLSMCPGPTTFEIRDLDITVGDGVAFCHCLNRCGGTGEDGEEKACWIRMTACYRKIDARWVVYTNTFRHLSIYRAAKRCSTFSRSPDNHQCQRTGETSRHRP